VRRLKLVTQYIFPNFLPPFSHPEIKKGRMIDPAIRCRMQKGEKKQALCQGQFTTPPFIYGRIIKIFQER